ncbi:MAG: N-acetyltransferase [Acidimicrobiia bacterium]|jgi:putative acetyltransferase
MLIRSERPADVPEISRLVAEAFRPPDSPDNPVPEVALVETLRASGAWIPEQSLVAMMEEEMVGYCLCTRAHVGVVACLALGPIGVAADRQRQGIGSALMNTAIAIGVDMGEPLIGLLGDPRFYGRFGFVPGAQVGIEPPDPSWGEAFQIKTLPAFRQASGVFRYPAAFADFE